MFGLAAMAAVVTLAGVVTTQVAPASAATCTPTGFIRDGIDLTAAKINPAGTVSGTVDATGCNIGIYYSASTGNVDNANVFGANYYGIVVNSDLANVSVNVSNSNVHNIGETPANGAQHGVAIYYHDEGPFSVGGVVSNNLVSAYQKGGIVATGGSISVLGNTVTGLGSVDFIAQNGIQIGFGASAEIHGNSVSGNDYTPKSYVSCGILYYGAAGVKASQNTMRDNEMNFCNFGEKGGGQYNPNP